MNGRKTSDAGAFTDLSGMPPSYFEKIGSDYPGADLSALRVFIALRGAARRIDTVVAHWLDPHGLTATKIDVLHLLATNPGGTSVARLREHLLMTQPNVAFVVGGLVADGLVRRSADPDDRRSILIRITPAGRRLVARMTGGLLAALEESVEVLAPAERVRFIAMLARLTQSFETASPPQ